MMSAAGNFLSLLDKPERYTGNFVLCIVGIARPSTLTLVGAPMALTLVTCSIPAGQSLSSGVSLIAGRLIRIRTPAAWRPANITFQCASNDIPGQYRDVYERFG